MTATKQKPASGDCGETERLLSKGVVNLNDACDLLGVKIRTLYDLMDAGKVPWTKVGRVRKIPRQAITDYLAKGLKGT